MNLTKEEIVKQWCETLATETTNGTKRFSELSSWDQENTRLRANDIVESEKTLERNIVKDKEKQEKEKTK